MLGSGLPPVGNLRADLVRQRQEGKDSAQRLGEYRDGDDRLHASES